MKRVIAALLMLVTMAEYAHAQTAQTRMLERQTARAIRNAGFWCDKVSEAAVDKVLSALGPTVVRVTCDDRTRYEQYKVTMTPQNRIAKIERWK
ncbi:hypothetical protein [Phyllobacterium lublinensis]|uniref:hypothetical protein n=1 Tax=Phyllobacterium lublinensis TaxID=2875708 RepID=UPI001CC9A83D|nr:hypothetical protein [Phyllobacterium sp. 2063]MBZ9657085.1 hypothetical protein [Phyllobacterium sp. 2063]